MSNQPPEKKSKFARLYEEKTVWCDKFISGLLPVYSKRSTETPIKPSLRGEKRLSGEKTPKSKVKKSKVEKPKEEKRVYGTFENVFL